MNIEQFDLNLLIAFDHLMRERNVSRAAERLHVSQPAMSNNLKRLRELLDDPLLVRTHQGMVPTERAKQLAPLVRQSLSFAEEALSPTEVFEPSQSQRVFRVLVSDYLEGTLIASLVAYLQIHAPMIALDVLTLSDGDFQDIEQAKIDLAINRFDSIPQSFHRRTLWQDRYACLVNKQHLLAKENTLENYLKSRHIWVSKTGVGAATGMSQESNRKRGWVDEALQAQGVERQIQVFTRHYQTIPSLVAQTDLVATLPSRAALLYKDHPDLLMVNTPFAIEPYEIVMVWSPILHHNSAHHWLRQQLFNLAHD